MRHAASCTRQATAAAAAATTRSISVISFLNAYHDSLATFAEAEGAPSMEPLPDDQHIGGDPSRAAAECLPRGRKRGRPSDLERLQREARAEALADLAAQQDGAEAEARAEAGHAEFPCDVNPLAKEFKIPTEVARSAGTIGLMSASMPLGAQVLKYVAARPRLDLDGIDEETQTFSHKVWGGSCPGTSAASLKTTLGVMRRNNPDWFANWGRPRRSPSERSNSRCRPHRLYVSLSAQQQCRHSKLGL